MLSMVVNAKLINGYYSYKPTISVNGATLKNSEWDSQSGRRKDIYTKNDGVNKIDVTINYENDLRKATKLFYLASEEQDDGVVFKVEDTKYFLEGENDKIS